MITNGKPPEPPDLSQYDENRWKFPPELLVPYEGKYVAFSPDGTRILASGVSLDEVDDQLMAQGIHFSQVVHEYIDVPG
jgi:hypothetical protein